MTNIERWEQRDILAQPEIISEAFKLARVITSTDFAPKAFRGKPEATMAALLFGRELGLGPMATLQRTTVIEGKPCLDAQGMRAVVLAAGHDIWCVESTPESCTMAGRRSGSEHEQTVTWTMKDAQRAGLANKGNWRTYPRNMLQARASAELCRLVAPDAIGGIGMSVEEVQDLEPEPRPTGRAAVARKPTAAAAAPELAAQVVTLPTPPAAPQATPAPSWDDPDDQPVDAEIIPTEPEMTSAQRRKIQAFKAELIRAGAMTEADYRAVVLDLTGGATESAAGLTKRQASDLIERMTQISADGPSATEPAPADEDAPMWDDADDGRPFE